MRTQYHLQPSPAGKAAWNVHRLIELSRGLPVVEVPLDRFDPLLDTVYWFDAAHPPTVRQMLEHMDLIADADLAHPILLGSDGRLMDGMHRVCKARRLGHRTIAARRFEVDPDPDYVDVQPEDLPYDE